MQTMLLMHTILALLALHSLFSLVALRQGMPCSNMACLAATWHALQQHGMPCCYSAPIIMLRALRMAVAQVRFTFFFVTTIIFEHPQRRRISDRLKSCL